MRSGFIYKSRHSSEFGIVARTKSRPVLPEMKSFTFESPAMDGVYDFSESNEYGRAFYNDRFFEIQLQIKAENLRQLEHKVSKIAVWLKGCGELIFDDMPFVRWNARVISELGFVPELGGKTTVMTVVFRTEPFGRCLFDTADGPALEIPATLNEKLLLDVPEAFIWNITGGANGYERIYEILSVVNAGNAPVRPIVRITGAVKNISLGCGGRTLNIKAQGSGFVVDCGKQTVVDLSGTSMMNCVTGDFFELNGEVCDITALLAVNGTASVCVEYEPRFIYDCDFDDVDWRASNA